MLMNQLLNRYLGYNYASNITNVGCSTPLHLRDYTGFKPSIAPAAIKAEVIGYSDPIHNNVGVVDVNSVIVHTHREYAMCADCNTVMNAHPVMPIYGDFGELISEGCERTPVDFGKTRSNDYYVYGDSNNVVPYVDYSYDGEQDRSRKAEWDHYATSKEFSTKDLYWSDNNPTECTRVFGSDEAPNGMQIETAAIEPKQRNYYIEGFDGFHSKQIYDEAITAKSHARYLNVYSKDGKFRVGGLVIEWEVTASPLPVSAPWYKIVATCPHRECRVKDSRGNYVQNTLSIEGYSFTREQMESFTYSVIRHGNNHCGMSNWTTRENAEASHAIYDSTVIHGDGTGIKPYRYSAKEVQPTYDDHIVISEANAVLLDFNLRNPKSVEKNSKSLTPWRINIPKHTVYYKVHSTDCDLTCDPGAYHCRPVLSEAG